MLLQGSLREFNLPNILQLVKMSASTGALSLRRGDTRGKIFFAAGSICYAFAQPQSVPIGQRFVNARYITPAQLRDEAAVAAAGAPGSGRLGSVLVEMGLIDRGPLDAVVREQIQDTVFDFFGWPDGEFEFNDDEVAEDEDIFVEMQVENVIMESCRRIDELEFILEQLGSLESVPRLAARARGRRDRRGRVQRRGVERAPSTSTATRDINTMLSRLRLRPLPRRQGPARAVRARPRHDRAAGDLEPIGEGVSVGLCGASRHRPTRSS